MVGCVTYRGLRFAHPRLSPVGLRLRVHVLSGRTFISVLCGFRKRPLGVLPYAPAPSTQHGTWFLRVMREILLPRHHRKNTIYPSFEKAWFRMKDAPVFLRFQWKISLSARKCWLSLRRARLHIFFKTSYIFNKSAAKPIFSICQINKLFVKSKKIQNTTKNTTKNNTIF